MNVIRTLILILCGLILIGCQNGETAVSQVQPATLNTQPTATSSPLPSSPTPIPPTPEPPATATSIPTSTPTSLPPTATTPPTATPIGPCDARYPSDDLLAVITKTYGMSRDYAPDDLISLNDYFGNDVTLGYPIEIRAIMLEPLTQLLNDMQLLGLQPQILSGYRSYSAQSIAFDKWLTEFPDRAAILSAPPGHSEHQLGTTVDFGSPNLADYIDDPEMKDLQFHTYFYQTPEGIWLAENAHNYGFTLSYPRDTFDLTGFYYEPWHYRYVGPEMATQLYEMELSLAELQFINQEEPCIP